MLILTRKIGQSLDIGQGITVTITDIGAARVKIGIDAPGVHVRRSELPPLAAPLPPLTADVTAAENPLESGGVGR